MKNNSVVTRFAPSPTGFLHIGNARTALFSWLFARHFGGKFLLRVEDTDRERSTQPAIDAIFSGLKWLGLDWDGEPVYQFSRMERHREIAYRLLAEGKAYKSFATVEELEIIREQALQNKKRPEYPGRDQAEEKNGQPFVIRFKAEREGYTVNEDGVQGSVKIDNAQLDDVVLLRSDGTPTYTLAVIVDDHDMGVTHVIRGDDHLTNAARQIQIFKALGWTPPHYYHIPLIHGEDGQKLSKRHGALGVDWYRDAGYLPQTMRNYLARLGWSHGDDEIFSDDQAIEWFDGTKLNKAPSRLDFARLDHLNGHYIRGMADDDLWERLRNFVTNTLQETIDNSECLRQAISLYKDRAKTLKELWDNLKFIAVDNFTFKDEKSVQLLRQQENHIVLQNLIMMFEQKEDWSADAVNNAIKEFLSEYSLKMPQVGPLIRAAVAGVTNTPNLGEVLSILGKKEVVRRLRITLS